MGDIFKEILNLFNGDEPLLRKILNLLIVATIIGTGIIALESAMGLITLGRLERKINLLKELNALTETGLGTQNDLNIIFNEAVNELDNYKPISISSLSTTLPSITQISLGEIFAGGAIWLLLSPIMFRTTKGGIITKLFGVGLIIVLGFVSGATTGFLIQIPNEILNLFANFFLGALFFVMIVLLFAYKQKRDKIQQTKIVLPEDQVQINQPSM